MRLAVVGNPGNRRVGLFTAAAARRGLPRPAVVPVADVLTGAESASPPGALVRIESPGEDAEVDRLLRGRPTRRGTARSRRTLAVVRGASRRLGRVAAEVAAGEPS